MYSCFVTFDILTVLIITVLLSFWCQVEGAQRELDGGGVVQELGNVKPEV